MNGYFLKLLFIILGVALLLSGCGGPRPPRTKMAPVPPPSPPPALTPQQAALEQAVLGFQGAPYRRGGTTPTGVDCSGLVQASFHQAGVNLPRTVAQQFTQGRPVALHDLRFGDVVFFNRYCQAGKRHPEYFAAGFFHPAYAETACHNGIYLGNGRFIHASPKGVYIGRLDAEVWRVSFMGARRFLSGWSTSK
ncbi:MAG: NlpC/P60 family protein [Syntrophales bacterium]|nr:NlpC/P60 family protein [Syntrophales bacterium]